MFNTETTKVERAISALHEIALTLLEGTAIVSFVVVAGVACMSFK